MWWQLRASRHQRSVAVSREQNAEGPIQSPFPSRTLTAARSQPSQLVNIRWRLMLCSASPPLWARLFRNPPAEKRLCVLRYAEPHILCLLCKHACSLRIACELF